MTTSFSNRGKPLEKAINKMLAHYEDRGIPCHQLEVKRLSDGTPVKKSPYDYEIFFNGTFYAFDAKECHEKIFHTSVIPLHQIKHLLNVHNHGGIAFFLVYFYPQKALVRFPVQSVIDSKTLAPEDGEKTTIDLLKDFDKCNKPSCTPSKKSRTKSHASSTPLDS